MKLLFWKRPRLSELGQEIFDMLKDEDAWEVNAYTLHHKGTGLELWIANGVSHFRIYRLARVSIEDSEVKKLLTGTDKDVLGARAMQIAANREVAPAHKFLASLRLARIKEQP